MILHIILPCSLADGGRSLAARLPAMFYKKWQHLHGHQLFHPSVLPRHVNRRSSRLLPHRASLISMQIRGRGGLNSEAKAQILVVTPPPPPLFPGSRSQKGGVTAGQYGIHSRIRIIRPWVMPLVVS